MQRQLGLSRRRRYRPENVFHAENFQTINVIEGSWQCEQHNPCVFVKEGVEALSQKEVLQRYKAEYDVGLDPLTAAGPQTSKMYFQPKRWTAFAVLPRPKCRSPTLRLVVSVTAVTGRDLPLLEFSPLQLTAAYKLQCSTMKLSVLEKHSSQAASWRAWDLRVLSV